MTLAVRLILVFAWMGIVAGPGARAAEYSETVKKARAYIGPEDLLKSLQSVHYRGTISTDDQQGVVVDILFQKPFFQKIVLITSDKVETTALDDYEGWQRIEDTKDPARWRLVLLPKEQVKRLRASTWEAFAFFDGVESRGGTVQDYGTTPLDEKPTHKIGFFHPDGIAFIRYFDVDSGKLVLTETEQGGTIREEGEILAGGLRFPKQVFTKNKLADGKERSITIVFDSITVNEPLPQSLFAVPAIQAR